MDNLKNYQICHDLITYFATLIFPKKSYLGLIFRNGGSIKINLSLSLIIMRSVSSTPQHKILLCWYAMLSCRPASFMQIWQTMDENNARTL